MSTPSVTKTVWPYDSEAAITCFMVKAPRAKLYLWYDGPFTGTWSYTLSAGRDSERSHSGRVAIDNLPIAEAAAIAIQQCKANNSWQ